MKYIITLIFILIIALHCQDQGARRIRELRQLSLKSPDRIISMGINEFKEYFMSYPRPYDCVVYFTAPSCKLCKDLYTDYQYMATLYDNSGIITQQKNPVFFFELLYSSEVAEIFALFDFRTAPNLVVSKPKMAVISQIQKKNYLQGFKWAISTSDGHVTTHKMLQFVNKRTGKDVIYKPTFMTMVTTLTVFLVVAVTGVLLYTKLHTFWMKWQVWFIGSLLIYITCVSGVVYDIIHDVPFVVRDNAGNVKIFSGGNREQYGAEGLVISMTISLIGVLFVLLMTYLKNMNKYTSQLFSIIALVVIIFLVTMVQGYYKQKGWYNPMWFPPGDYIKGHYLLDQGNNI